MVEIIAGNKGKGKTKVLISKANDSALLTNGSIVYLDKNNKHMYELSNRIRMINVPEFHIENFDMFCGFLYGIASQDHDLEQIYFDSFLTIAHIEEEQVQNAIEFLVDFSESRNIHVIVSLSMNAEQLPEAVGQYVSISL